MEQDDQVDHDGDHGSHQQLQSTVCTRVVSKFHFVDLAGSERVSRTENKGERFRGKEQYHLLHGETLCYT